VVPKGKWEELVFKGHFVQWHDVEFGSNLTAAEEVLALVVQKRNALKNMIFTQVSDSILCKDCLFQLQGCLWTSLLARGDVTKQINRDWNLDELKLLWSADGAIDSCRRRNWHAWGSCLLVLALSCRDLRPGKAELEWHLNYVARVEVRSEFPDLHLIVKAKMASCFYSIRM